MRERYPVLMELGRTVSPERRCRDAITAAIALWKRPPKRAARHGQSGPEFGQPGREMGRPESE